MSKKNNFTLSAGDKVFVTSDVHSYYNQLQEALAKAGFDENAPEHKLIVCGDLFDRGGQPKKVLEFCQSLGSRFGYVRGNHEDLLEECVHGICDYGFVPGDHHYSNGTVKTIANLCSMDETIFLSYLGVASCEKVGEKMAPILRRWINGNSVDCISIGDYRFVHGWIPTLKESELFAGKAKFKPFTLEKWESLNSTKRKLLWEQARWTNGMQAWKDGCMIKGKTIVCGHFHCSWGWSHISQKRKEFPPKSRKGWQESFEPFKDKGIIAIDSCCAYTGFLNVLKFDVDENLNLKEEQA